MTSPGFLRAGFFVSSLRLRRAQRLQLLHKVAHIIRAAAGKDAGKRNAQPRRVEAHAASVPAPALAPVRSHFACGETALAGYRPHLLGLPRKIARGISLRETTLADVLACPVYRTENALFCSCRVFQYLTRQVKASFY